MQGLSPGLDWLDKETDPTAGIPGGGGGGGGGGFGSLGSITGGGGLKTSASSSASSSGEFGGDTFGGGTSTINFGDKGGGGPNWTVIALAAVAAVGVAAWAYSNAQG